MNKYEKISAVRKALIRNASLEGVVFLEDLQGDECKLLGMTFRGLVQFIRLNQEDFGGVYVPSRKILGDPRAFNGNHRLTRWTHAKYLMKSKIDGAPCEPNRSR